MSTKEVVKRIYLDRPRKQRDMTSQRTGYVRSLVMEWIKRRRNDVYEAALDAAYVKFPTKSRKSRHVKLPASLTNLK